MVKTGFIDEVEVELEFADGQRHVDIRFGILNHGVLDRDERSEARDIRIGVIGTPNLIDGFLGWLETCGEGVAAKETNKPNLFPRFPGFGKDSPFNAELICDARAKRSLSTAEIAALDRLTTPGGIVRQAASL